MCRKVFSAGASHYGVADLQLLAAETHKFESRYLDGLIGAWPADKAVYKERSPINALDKFDSPVAFFQVPSPLSLFPIPIFPPPPPTHPHTPTPTRSQKLACLTVPLGRNGINICNTHRRYYDVWM